jgi:molybdopterin/thiamine biosynthesis adenylyltransferase
MLTEQQITRYSRQIILEPVGGKGQQRLLSSSAAIVGRGEMATIAALYLTAAGIGKITLTGPHSINPDDLEALNPDCQVVLSSASLDAVAAEDMVRRHDLIIVAGAPADTTASLNLACVRLGKPLVWGGAGRGIGRMAVLAGERPGTPCYGCLQRCLHESRPDGDSNQPLSGAVFDAVAGFVGTLQATAAIKLIIELEASAPARLLTYDALAAVVRDTNIVKDPRCEICGAEQPVRARQS